jgi:hypothetical protein
MEPELQALQTLEAAAVEAGFLNPPWLMETAAQAAPASSFFATQSLFRP